MGIVELPLITNLILSFSTCVIDALDMHNLFDIDRKSIRYYLLCSHYRKLYMRTKEKVEKLKNCAKQFKEKLRTQQNNENKQFYIFLGCKKMS